MTAIKKNTEVTLEGRGQLTIRPNDHVATGGEGSAYRAGKTIIKLYTDTQKMKRDGMDEKIQALKAVAHPFIVAPQGLVMDNAGKPIGFYMPFSDGEPMPRVFTNDFRKRTGFIDKDAIVLTHRMQEAVAFAHQKGAVLVDANEFNWLAVLGAKGGPEPRAIDVDSWAIGRWPASVVMLSIRDWHTRGFTPLSDWFGWGVVSFQIFTGIHPYRGKLDGFDAGDLEKRMKANASVFEKGVRLNMAVRDFSCIPGPLMDWYIATFKDKERTVPPSPFQTGKIVGSVGRVLRMVATASGSLIYTKIFEEPNDETVRIFSCGIALLNSGRLVDLRSKRTIGKTQSHNAEVVRVSDGWLVADIVFGKIEFSFVSATNFTKTQLPLQVTTYRFFRFENRLFLITEDGMTELEVMTFGKPILSTGREWGVLTNSTTWFDGFGIQDTLGATYAVLPFGNESCAQVRVRELDGFRVVSGRAGERFLSLVAADRKGEYHKFEFTFESNYSAYFLWQGKTDSPDCNIAILPKGVCATVAKDGELVIFVPRTGTINRVADKDIATDMALAHWDDKVLYTKDGAVWHVRMR
ncbi:MAG TPA: hypothetical protein VJB70_04555 [Candidatus Paceibacterota bacterium]